MGVLLPFFLAAGALIGVPIALHLLRRKPRIQVVFPTLQFLGASAVLETRRHRIRRWLTLLFRCLIILLICFAFARPFWHTDRLGHGRAVVIAIDNSFSMQARGRWEHLQNWASGQLSSLGPGDRAGLLLMNPTPRWLMPLTDKIDQVHDALGALQPGYETTRYEPALRVAGDALIHSDAPDLTLVWMADEQELGWQGVNFSSPLPGGVKLVAPPPLEVPAHQAAIARTHWETNGNELALRVDINAYTPEQDTRQITLTANGHVVAQQKIALTAGHPNSVLLTLTGLKPEDVSDVKVEMDRDDLPADDTFYAVHDKDASATIFLTPLEGGPDNYDFLRHAINSTKAVTAAPLQAQDLPDTAWPVASVVVVRGSKPFQPPLVSRLETFLKAGGAACFFLDGSSAPSAWMKQHHLDLKPVLGSTYTPLHLRNWDLGHPLLAPIAANNLIGLLDVEFYRGVSLTSLDATPLATWEDGRTAIAEVSTGGLRFLACGFDPERGSTNWPVHASFLPFIHSALLWLSREQNAGGDWRVGDTIPLSGNGAWKSVDGTVAEAQVSGSVRPQEPGLYQFTSNGQTRLYAVNLQPEESNLAPWSTPNDFKMLTAPSRAPATVQPATVELSQEDAENQQRVWWWLLALAVILVLAELRLANRTSL